ncbi:hypothetical protein HANVADRAFT_51970 [Hanseniaspora valbyensis NRRL Y-1626]|uniref:SWR1-complex protein 4 n=1 Tax=Hanseniaspora valbyensis NRRL Y-1626 TaxID=766949 RepID=A0A1B7TGP0_9ASCO|nr:hypothetical protein HANVADRAFT_51970 [Hanseniaspora valbyensis NRRL Y-1626]
MSSKNDLMDIMDNGNNTENTNQNSISLNNLKNTKRQLYNAIGDKIPSLKIDKNNTNNKITKNTKPVSKWKFSNRVKHNNHYYQQWIKSSSDNSNADIDITYKYDKYNHQYKIPYFISADVFNKAVEKYREAHIPKLKETIKIEFDKEKQLFALKKEKEKQEKEKLERERLEREKQEQEKLAKDKEEKQKAAEAETSANGTEKNEEKKNGETQDVDMDSEDKKTETRDVDKESSAQLDKENEEEKLKEPDYDLEANILLNEKLKLLSFENVEQILELAKEFDLKWIVIQDRFNIDNRTKKISLSVPEIKYIFYKSCTIFFQYNNRSEMNSLLNFDLEKDINRQKNLERLFNRSAAEVAEEEALILEAKKFEVTSKKIKEERDNIVKLLDYPKTQSNFIPEQFLSASGFSQLYKSLMKMRSSASNNNKFSKFPENPWKLQFSKFKSQKQKLDPESNNSNNHINSGSSSNNINNTVNDGNDTNEESYKLNFILSSLSKRAGNNITQANTKNEMIYELISHLTDFEKDKLHIELNSNMYAQSGISLNSSKLTTNRTSVESKIEKLYQELEIPPKPIMMTSNLIQGYNFLNGVLLECVNIKQSIDKMDADNKIKTNKK